MKLGTAALNKKQTFFGETEGGGGWGQNAYRCCNIN